MESFQNPSILSLDLSQFIIVKLNKSLQESMTWSTVKQNDALTHGQLNVDLSEKTDYSTLDIHIFLDDPIDLQWTL